MAVSPGFRDHRPSRRAGPSVGREEATAHSSQTVRSANPKPADGRWWLASDGRWYPPELHPTRLVRPAMPRTAPVADGYRVGPTGTGTSPWPPTAAPGVPERKRLRAGAVLLGAAGALVGLWALALVFGLVVGLATRPSGRATAGGEGTVHIPNRAPTTLAGESADPAAISENPAWESLAQRAGENARSSFASVYGNYPPLSMPTTKTFLVVGQDAAGPPHVLGNAYDQLRDGLESTAAGLPGSQVHMLSPASLFGGETVCGGLTATTTSVGECFWATPYDLVQVVTFSPSLPAVRQLTERVLTQLEGSR